MHRIVLVLRTATQKTLRILELALFLPFVLFAEAWRSERRLAKKIATSIFALGVLLPIWIVIYLFFGLALIQSGQFILYRAGLLQDKILIAGTGSMYPTFPKGQSSNDVARFNEVVADSRMRVFPGGITIGPFELFAHTLAYGDIISFENDATRTTSREKYGEEAGFVKRVIGLPGDTIEIRNGFVYRNGSFLEEPYTARARSTYGGISLPDCQQLKIPPEHVFVLGDNRIASNDSRHDIGLISVTDVDHVLPFADQEMFQSRWRDASTDKENADAFPFDPSTYVALLNDKRREAHVSALVFEPRLVTSAISRGEVMLATDDLSFEATQSGYTIEQSFADSGYRNILSGESSTLGFLTAEELLENSFEFPRSREFLLNADFDDIGVAVVAGEINECPTQVVVQHFGGFLPPNYSQAELTGWQELLDSLNSAIPTWEEVRNFSAIYARDKDSFDRLITVLHRRREIANTILSRMQENQWFTDSDNAMLQEDEQIAGEAERLIEQLNTQ